jgi:heat shock protein HtpX
MVSGAYGWFQGSFDERMPGCWARDSHVSGASSQPAARHAYEDTRCSNTGSRELSRLQRHLHRAMNERQSGRVMTGMFLLLALCGWVRGGEDEARNAVNRGVTPPTALPISPEIMQQRFGARLLRAGEYPALFHVLETISRRARLPRLPDIYILPHSAMNAYALGGPDGSAITLTEGLLRGMTLPEVAGILAHEVAHIRNDDGWALSLAAGLNRAIAFSSLAASMSPPAAYGRPSVSQGPLDWLLGAAPKLGELLCLALSRVRELDADALALELTDDPQALASALEKLERHHSQFQAMPMSAMNDDWSSLLRSHPTTWLRVSILLALGRTG